MNKLIILSLFISCICQSQTKIKIDFMDGFNDSEKTIVFENISKLEELINSPEFEKRVSNYKTFCRNKIPALSKKRKYKNIEVLELIRGGKELNSDNDNVINLKLNLYDSESKEIGYTDTDLQIINTRRAYFQGNHINYYLSHLLHEYCHILGFRHAYNRALFRNNTVPYAIGNITKEILTINDASIKNSYEN